MVLIDKLTSIGLWQDVVCEFFSWFEALHAIPAFISIQDCEIPGLCRIQFHLHQHSIKLVEHALDLDLIASKEGKLGRSVADTVFELCMLTCHHAIQGALHNKTVATVATFLSAIFCRTRVCAQMLTKSLGATPGKPGRQARGAGQTERSLKLSQQQSVQQMRRQQALQ